MPLVCIRRLHLHRNVFKLLDKFAGYKMKQQWLIIYMFNNFSFQCDYRVDIGSSESFLHGGELPTLIVQSTGHAVHVFINGQLSGRLFVSNFFLWTAFLSVKK